MHRTEEITHVEDPDDVVERAAVHGIAREGGIHDGAQRLLGRHVDRDADDLGSWNHDRRDFLGREVEDLVEHLLLRLVQLAHVLGSGDRVPNVLTRVRDHPGRRRPDAQKPKHGIGRDLEHPDDRMQEAAEVVERNREHNSERLGLLERHRLRHQLAEHDREVGEERECNEEAHRYRQRRLHQIRDQRLADRTDEDGEDGDPELRARDEPNRLVHQS